MSFQHILIITSIDLYPKFCNETKRNVFHLIKSIGKSIDGIFPIQMQLIILTFIVVKDGAFESFGLPRWQTAQRGDHRTTNCLPRSSQRILQMVRWLYQPRLHFLFENKKDTRSSEWKEPCRAVPFRCHVMVFRVQLLSVHTVHHHHIN